MKISWGWKVTLLYTSFVIMMVGLVIASSSQKFDLVSNNYYQDEVAYQKVIDADKNLTSLPDAVQIHANEKSVVIDLPKEFEGKPLSGDVTFYSPVNKDWDRVFKLTTGNSPIDIPRSQLMNTKYVIKISCIAGGKSYYQESDLQLRN